MATHQPYIYDESAPYPPQYPPQGAAQHYTALPHYAAVPAHHGPVGVGPPVPGEYPAAAFAPPAAGADYGGPAHPVPPQLQSQHIHPPPPQFVDGGFGASRSHGSSVSSRSTGPWEQLPACPDDSGCMRVNERDHQREFSHTCRLFPCYHAHLPHHVRCFRHQPGQGAEPPSSDAGSTAGASAPLGPDAGGGALRSGNASDTAGSRTSETRRGRPRPKQRRPRPVGGFAHMSPDCPGATKITVSRGGDAFEVHGDWARVPLHTMKRYVHQVVGVPAAAIVLHLRGVRLEGELKMASELGVVAGVDIAVSTDDTRVADFTASSAAPASNPKIPVNWL